MPLSAASHARPVRPLQMWHWNNNRVVAQYYTDLAKREAAEEAAHKAAIKAKLSQLEEELAA